LLEAVAEVGDVDAVVIAIQGEDMDAEIKVHVTAFTMVGTYEC